MICHPLNANCYKISSLSDSNWTHFDSSIKDSSHLPSQQDQLFGELRLGAQFLSNGTCPLKLGLKYDLLDYLPRGL